MKKQFLWAAMAAVTLFGTSCSNNDEPKPENEGNEVTFVIGGIASRTVTTDNYATNFVANDEIGIFSSGLTSDMTNVKFTVPESGDELTAENGGSYTFNGNTTANFYAYYPYSTTIQSTNAVNISIQTDQSTEENLNKSDFLIASGTGSSSNTTVSLQFTHQMAFVELLFGDNLSALGIESVTMHNSKSGATYNFTNHELTSTDVTQGNNADIKMYNATDGGNTTKFWAIVPPQTTTGGTLFTIETANGKAYTYSGTETFESNKIRKIKLEIGEGGNGPVFKKASVTVNNWGNVNNVTEENKNVQLSGITIKDVGAGDAQNKIDASKFTNAGSWGYAGITAEYNANDESIKITSATDNTSKWWSNHALYFCHALNTNIESGKTYTLSFKVKGTSNNKIEYFVCSNNSIAYKMGDNKTSTSVTINSEDFTEYKCTTIDLSQTSNNASTNATLSSNASNTGNIIIGFRPTTYNSAVYYIKDISFTENE